MSIGCTIKKTCLLNKVWAANSANSETIVKLIYKPYGIHKKLKISNWHRTQNSEIWVKGIFVLQNPT